MKGLVALKQAAVGMFKAGLSAKDRTFSKDIRLARNFVLQGNNKTQTSVAARFNAFFDQGVRACDVSCQLSFVVFRLLADVLYDSGQTQSDGSGRGKCLEIAAESAAEQVLYSLGRVENIPVIVRL